MLISFTLAAFLFATNLTVLNVIHEHISRDHELAPAAVAWASNAFFVVLVGALVPFKARRSVFVSAVAVFGLASLLGAFFVEAAVLIAVRGVQGLAAGVAIRAGFVLVVAAFRGARVWPMVVMLSVAGALGLVGGPTVGVVINEVSAFTSILLADVVLAILVAASFPPLPATSDVSGGRIR
ncbi:hypothetical protein GCM10018965_037520 [Nonomuraea roseola]